MIINLDLNLSYVRIPVVTNKEKIEIFYILTVYIVYKLLLKHPDLKESWLKIL